MRLLFFFPLRLSLKETLPIATSSSLTAVKATAWSTTLDRTEHVGFYTQIRVRSVRLFISVPAPLTTKLLSFDPMKAHTSVEGCFLHLPIKRCLVKKKMFLPLIEYLVMICGHNYDSAYISQAIYYKTDRKYVMSWHAIPLSVC